MSFDSKAPGLVWRNRNYTPLYRFTRSWMPWELSRGRRILGHMRQVEVQYWAQFQSELDQGHVEQLALMSEWAFPERSQIQIDLIQTRLLYPFRSRLAELRSSTQSQITLVSYRRAWSLAMALHEWRAWFRLRRGVSSFDQSAFKFPRLGSVFQTLNPFFFAGVGGSQERRQWRQGSEMRGLPPAVRLPEASSARRSSAMASTHSCMKPS